MQNTCFCRWSCSNDIFITLEYVYRVYINTYIFERNLRTFQVLRRSLNLSRVSSDPTLIIFIRFTRVIAKSVFELFSSFYFTLFSSLTLQMLFEHFFITTTQELLHFYLVLALSCALSHQSLSWNDEEWKLMRNSVFSNCVLSTLRYIKSAKFPILCKHGDLISDLISHLYFHLFRIHFP